MPNCRSSPRWTLALTSMAFFMVALDALVVATALPAIRHDLHASISTLQWTVNAYSLTYGAGIITAAALGAIAPADIGKASGVNSTMQRFGGVFGVAIATAVVASNGHLGATAAFTAGFRPVLASVAALSLLGAISAAAVGSRRRRVAKSSEPAPVAAPALTN